MLRSSWMVSIALVIFVAVVPCVRAQDDKVFRELTPEATEKLLKELKVEFKKESSPKGEEHYFEYQSGGYKMRLTHVSKKELMLECAFRAMPMEKVNQYNSVTRVARVSYQRDNNGPFTVLEYGLDISGGVTAGTIKQYLARFQEEVVAYDRFVIEAVSTETFLSEINDEKLENILKTQGIKFTKKANPSGVTTFDFELNKHKLRMYNFGGKDLMIDAHFKKLPLSAVNRYNLNRKFVRVVNYKGKDVEYTALECNLDCEAGVTEGAIRNWIVSFGGDVEHFAEYAKKLQDLERR